MALRTTHARARSRWLYDFDTPKTRTVVGIDAATSRLSGMRWSRIHTLTIGSGKVIFQVLQNPGGKTWTMVYGLRVGLPTPLPDRPKERAVEVKTLTAAERKAVRRCLGGDRRVKGFLSFW